MGELDAEIKVRIPRDMRDALEAIRQTRARGTKLSSLVRDSIEDYLEKRHAKSVDVDNSLRKNTLGSAGHEDHTQAEKRAKVQDALCPPKTLPHQNESAPSARSPKTPGSSTHLLNEDAPPLAMPKKGPKPKSTAGIRNMAARERKAGGSKPH